MKRIALKDIVVPIFFAAALGTLSPHLLARPIGKAERAERASFIRKANALELKRLGERQEAMHREGVYPTLSVKAYLVPFADWDYYYVSHGSIVWEPNSSDQPEMVEVPEGFVTDLASIPRIFWQVLRPEGKYTYAAVVHDWLYWEQGRSREEADRIFKIAMTDSGVDPKVVSTLYSAVRTLGESAWKENARLKESGERRRLLQVPRDFRVRWVDWKEKAGVFDVTALDQEVPPYRPAN